MADDETDPLLKPAARTGCGFIDGAVWRPGDPVKHLGPPYAMADRGSPAFYFSQLFSTRCGLGPRYDDGSPMYWSRPAPGENDDYWCVPCCVQGGIRYELWTDDTDYRDPLPWQIGGRDDEPGPGP